MEKIIKIHDFDNYSLLLQGIKVIKLNKINPIESVPQIPNVENLNISETLTCSFCKISFDNSVEQRKHYKTDWHRYNLKQNLRSSEPITEDGFDKLADDVSSISGSDSETDDISDKSDNVLAINQGKIFFQNAEGKVFSLYRNLLHEKKDIPSSDEIIAKFARQSLKNTFWTVLMLGGGHFAGAVYNGSEVILHKTFHCYTVRAKQGGSQGSRDNKSSGSHSKSAGSSLRRYNEQALIQHVGDILQSWSQEIEKSNIIFYRAAGPYNRSVLFGGRNPILKKTDTRLRTIPFSTRRPTFTELQRVHDTLNTVEIYSSLDAIITQYALKTTEEQDLERSRRASPRNKNINRAKSREVKERAMPGDVTSSDDDQNGDQHILNTEIVALSLSDLQEYADTVPEQVKKQKQTRKKKPKKKDRVKKWEEITKKELYNICYQGNLDSLNNLVTNLKAKVNDEDETQYTREQIVNMVIDEHGNTPLHIAALNKHREMITWLMQNDATPCSKNDKLQTAYTVNSDKIIRNVFRNFAAENPDKYNYAKSQIPIATKTEEELAEKKKALRKIKREKVNVKKKENDIKIKENDERDRFLKLSDREKRALAAERRMLAQSSAVLVRCFLCAEDISGKVPFEYSGNRFCSISCLKAHRFQNPVVLS